MYQYQSRTNQLSEEEEQMMKILSPATSKSHQLKSMLMKWKCFGVIGVVFTILILLVFCSISPKPLTNPKTSRISTPQTTSNPTTSYPNNNDEDYINGK